MNEHEPEARGWPQPGEVWSLWEMYQLHASKLFPLIISLRQQGIEKHSDEDLDRPLDDDLRPDTKAYLEETLRNCTALRARIAGRAARDLLNGIKSPLFTYREWNDGLREIYNTLEREIEDVSLFVPKSEYAGLLDDANPPFGDDVLTKFSESARDISEAGKCLALSRNTACVFHLMLAMEGALRALAGKIKADLLNKNGQFEKWSTLVSRIKDKVPSLPLAEQDEWIGAHNLLWGVGKVWRNDTMHPSDAYSDEEAKTIWEAVKTFMRHLAPLV